VAVCVGGGVSQVVSDQRFLGLDDVSLNPTVVKPPLPEEREGLHHHHHHLLLLLLLISGGQEELTRSC